MKIIIALIFCLISPTMALAKPATACHCFKDRSFVPAYPGKADPYLLATTQNSFLASVFGIDKKEIVRAKMEGASGNLLWIACFVAKIVGVNADTLMAERKTAGSWKVVLKKSKIDLSKSGSHFKKAIASDASDDVLASVIVDQMLIDRLGAKAQEVNKLRSKGANSKEVILSTFLSLRSRRAASDYYNSVTTGQSTWDAHLNSLGIKPKDVGLEISKMVK